jgi:hypothetical protein
VGYLICSKCKGYYKLASGERVKDFASHCDCGGKLRYIENLDIIDPHWKPIKIAKKPTKKEFLTKKIKSLFTLPKLDIKNRLSQFYNNSRAKRNYNTRNQRTINRNPYGMDAGLITSIMAELNFQNLRWIIILPVTIAITLILAFTPGIFTLFTFIFLMAVGYLFEHQIIGTKNAIVTGALSFFLASLLTGSFLYIIPYTLLGVINGAVCGWIGGYIKSRV